MKLRLIVLCIFLGIYLTKAKSLKDEKPSVPTQNEGATEPAKQKELTETNTITPEKTKTSNYGNTDLEDYPEDTEENETVENIDEEDPESRTKVQKKDSTTKKCCLGFGPFGHGHGFSHGGFVHGFGHGGFGHGFAHGGFGHGFGYGGYGHGFGHGYGHGFGGYGGHSIGYGVGRVSLGFPGGFHGGFHGGYPSYGYGGPWIRPGWGYGEDEGFHGDGYPGFFARSFKDPKDSPKKKGGSKKSAVPNKDKNPKEEEEAPSKKCFYGEMGGHCGHPPLFPYNVQWKKTKKGYSVEITKVDHKGDCNWPWLYGSGFGLTGHGW